MHAIEGSGNVPAFLTKLWRLVDDAQTNDLISWTQNGRSFIIRNQAKFARELLPQYYKHNNMASFVRQLNMYGFHKVVSADSGGLRLLERDEMEFAHPHFLRGQEGLIENIKRKQQRRLASDAVDFSQIPTSRTLIVEENKSVNKLLNDVRDMKHDQETMNTKVLSLKRENEALWREYANMRQKFSKQQQIIEKLIHFLIAMVKSPSKTLAPKRKFHLALEGGEDITSAAAKLSNLSQLQGASVEVVGGSTSGTGCAQIQEVTDGIDLEDTQTNMFSVDSVVQEVEQMPVMHTTTTTRVPQEVETFEEVAVDLMEPETILGLDNSDSVRTEDTTSKSTNVISFTSPVTVPTVVSPGGTHITEASEMSFASQLLDEAPLSPELLNTVDPSAVTQSFKYATTSTPLLSSSGSNGLITSASSNKKPTPSTSNQIIIPQKGKAKAIKTEKNTSKSTMSVAVPDKSLQKNSKGPTSGGQEFQSHVDDMQTTIDSLQDLLTSGTLNVDPSMLISMFASDDNYLPELDSMATTSGTELSVYNPSLLDLAGDIEEGDPFTFINSTTASTSASPSMVSAAGPSPPKQLKLSIKKEPREEYEDLETPQISPPAPTKPFFRGKKRGN